MANLCKKATPRNGAAAVEFALLLPLLLTLFLAAVDFARIYQCSQILADSARLGAVYLSNPDVSTKTHYGTVQAAVEDCVRGLSPPPTMSSRNGIDGRGNHYYEVTMTYTFSLISRAVGAPATITISRSAQARMYSAAVAEVEL